MNKLITTLVVSLFSTTTFGQNVNYIKSYYPSVNKAETHIINHQYADAFKI